jgi:hypothetical protein
MNHGPASSQPLSCPDLRVRTARPDDLPFLLHLQRTHSNELGYLPGPAISRRIDTKNAFVAVWNGQHAGYLLTADTNPAITRVLQIAVPTDARRQAIATLLLTCCTADIVQAWCRDDIDAARNFWPALKFRPVATRPGGNGRQQAQTLFRATLNPTAMLYKSDERLHSGRRQARDVANGQLLLFQPAEAVRWL